MKIALMVVRNRNACPYRDTREIDWGPNSPRCEHPNNGPPPVKVLFCEHMKTRTTEPFPKKCPLGDFDMSGLSETVANPIVKQLLDALSVDGVLRDCE